MRGAVTAAGMAIVAGAVHGVIAAGFDVLWVKLAIGTAGAVVLIMAGAISARRTVAGAVLLGLSMAVLFFSARWGGWSLMQGGFSQLGAFLATPPWAWARYLSDAGISGLWVVELTSMLIPALLGCLVGQERAA